MGWDSATQTVTVTDPHVPSPSFTVSPNPACSTGPVRFNASASSDQDELRQDSGPAHTTLRLTDNDGRTAETNRVLVIDDDICRPAAAAAVSAAAVEHKARFTLTLNGRAANRGIRLISGNHLTSSKFHAGGACA